VTNGPAPLEDSVTGGRLDDACGCIAGYFDPTVFTLPAAGTLGSGVGRNSLRGPGLLTVDVAVSKNVNLTGRRVRPAARRGLQSLQPGELRRPERDGLRRDGTMIGMQSIRMTR
jgi:hypothetical protein